MALASERLAALDDPRGQPPDLVVEFASDDHPAGVIPRPTGHARALFEPDYELEYFEREDVLRFVDDGVAALVNPAAGHARIVARPSDERSSFIATHVFLTLALLELAKRRDRFAIHAASVASRGCGLLIAGPSGSGKTTLSLACVDAGFAFMGDDIALARASPADITVHAFPDEISVGERSLRLLSHLVPKAASTTLTGKRRIAVAELGAVRAPEAALAAVVFPTISATSRPRLEAMSPDDAFVRLLPNALRTATGPTQRHLDMLALVARSVPSYQLEVNDPHAATPALLKLVEPA